MPDLTTKSKTLFGRTRRHGWRRLFNTFRRDERGNVVVFVVVSLPIFFLLATIAVDVGYLWSVQAHLRAAGDAAVLAAVRSLKNTDRATELAIEYATKNMPTAEHGNVLLSSDVAFGKWDADSAAFYPGDEPLNAVKAVLRRGTLNDNPVNLFFAQYVGMGSPNVVVEAVAALSNRPGNLCVLALDDYASGGFETVGTSYVKLIECGLAVNSSSTSALNMTGNTEVYIEKAGVTVVGDISQVGGAILDAPFPPATGSSPVPDPFADLQVPYGSTCDHQKLRINTDTSLEPGIYCSGLTMQGNVEVTMNPGVYVIKDGDLRIQGGANVTGYGVAIVLTGGSSQKVGSVALAGHSDIILTAPMEGAFKGIQIYQDRIASPNGRNQIVGTSRGGAPTKLQFNGVLYFPARELFIAGNTKVSAEVGGCVAIVAHTIKMAGNGELEIQCEDTLAKVVGPQPLGVSLRK